MENPIKWLKKQTLKILVPYYVFLIIALLGYSMFTRETLSFVKIVKLMTCSGTIDGVQHLWFIPYILFCYFLTPYLQNIRQNIESKGVKVITFVLFAIMVFSVVYWFLFDSFFRADRVICYFVGYFLAVVSNRYNSKLKKITIIVAMIAVPMNTVRILVKYVLNIEFSGTYTVLFDYFVYFAHAALGVLLFLIMYQAFNNVKYGSLLRISDKYSYYVYLTHHIFILGPLSLLSIINVPGLNVVIVFMCTIIASVIICWISKKILKLIRYD